MGEGAWERWRGPNRGEASGNCGVERGPDAARPSGAAGLIEVELGFRLGVRRIEGGRLVEVVGGERIHRSDGIGVELECGLGRSACIPLLSAVISDLPDRVGKGTVRENLEAVTAAAIEFYAVVFPMGASLFAEPKLLNAFRDGLIERGTGPHMPLQALAAYLQAERDHGRLAPDVDPPAVAALLLGACFHRALLVHFAAPPVTGTDRTAPEALVAALCTPLLAERYPPVCSDETDRRPPRLGLLSR